MKEQLISLDNISDKVLDTLNSKYKDDPNFRVYDERKKLSMGKPREYFLISKRVALADRTIEWTFIWIENNLWQYSYLNAHCQRDANWVNPVDLLNRIL